MSWIETSDLHSVTGLFLTLRLRFTLLTFVEKPNALFVSLAKNSAREGNCKAIYLKKFFINNLNLLIQMRVSLYIGL